jgi:gliding motility associated protien GldN
MKVNIIRVLFLAVFVCAVSASASAQKRSSKKRTTQTKTKTKVTKAKQTAADTTAAVVAAPEPKIDSLPVKIVKPSLRPDEAVETSVLRDRTPMPYEHLRSDDAAYRHRIWREIDTREKLNQSFRYTADADNGNQRFISILLQALQDSVVTAFNSIDDRFTTPMSKSEIAKALGAEEIEVPQFDSVGNPLPPKKVKREIPLDSFYRFHVKEEVIYDKESSRLFWRILGIAPVRKVRNSQDIELGDAEVFWIYYPDMRPIFSKYEVYNPKNYGGRMSWEELFEGRMFSGRIYKSSMDNPLDKKLDEMDGLKEKTLHQLYEGENIKEKIFNYEQDLWSY